MEDKTNETSRLFECCSCPFYGSIKCWNDSIQDFEYIDWCHYDTCETGICGSCNREPTVLDEVEVETDEE